MRTEDFSHAPGMGRAGAMFVGGTKFTGPVALVQLYLLWRPMVRRLRAAPGYCGHRTWYGLPFTFGTMAFFSDRAAMLRFARSPEHAELMRWVMEPGNARGGFIRLHEAAAHGYSSGVWRAEGGELRAIEQFSPLDSEAAGPPVPARQGWHRRLRTRHGGTGGAG